jgi:hypothetical protein
VIQHSLLKYGKSISEVDDHPTIKIVLDIRQKNFGEFVVRNFPVAVAVSVDHRFVHNELYHVLKQMVGNNLKEAQLQQIVDKTMIYADSDGDGKISYDEFTKILLPYVKNDLYRRMVIDF